MRIETWPINQIKPNSWNPNEMENHIFESLVHSIQTHGVLQPILIRPEGTIIKGEKRWRAAQKAGIKEVTCVVVETSDEEAKLLTASLSLLRGHTNEEMLASLMEELAQHFDLDELARQTGFSTEDLSSLIGQMHTDTDIDVPVEDDGFDVQAALDTIKDPETNYGDIWKLGTYQTDPLIVF